MSWQATAWAVRQKTGSAGCKLLLLTLANYADDTGCCWPGQDTLKNDTEQSLDTIQRQLKKLETLGLVRKVPRPMGPGRWSSRTYFLNMTAAEMTKPQSAAWSEDDATGRQPTEPTGSERNDGVTPAVQSMPQGTWDHAAADPVTMPHQARDHAAADPVTMPCSATIWMGTQRQSGWPFRRSRREDDCRGPTITQAIFA
jgi:hypothetical protein